MCEDSVYQSPASKVPDDLEKRRQAPLYWTRMLRFSIYFTILGVILCVLLVIAGRNAAAQTEDGVSSMLTSLETLIFSSKFLMMFLIMGITSSIISLIMRGKEKRHRNSSSNAHLNE